MNLDKFEKIINESFNKKEEIYHDHIHLNKMGHKVYADYMSKKIKKIIDENQ